MSTVGKIITLLIFGALFVAAISHAAGFSAVAMATGSELDQTLNIETGSGLTTGTKGTVTFPTGGSVNLG